MAIGAPLAELRPHVTEYVGWIEDMVTPMRRRELPTCEVPVIINFGAPYRVSAGPDGRRWTDVSSFATGAYDTCALVESTGASGGVQINFTILGARLFLGQPLGDLTNSAVALDAVLGPEAARLTDELHTAPDWAARFAILDRVIRARLLGVQLPAAPVLWTWRRLVETRGRVRVGTIVDEIGWSQKHLIARFREEIGLAPKTLGRVLRFSHAVGHIKQGSAPGLADVAAACGYYDQAHFSRDCRELAGASPRDLVASLLPDRGGFVADT